MDRPVGTADGATADTQWPVGSLRDCTDSREMVTRGPVRCTAFAQETSTDRVYVLRRRGYRGILTRPRAGALHVRVPGLRHAPGICVLKNCQKWLVGR